MSSFRARAGVSALALVGAALPNRLRPNRLRPNRLRPRTPAPPAGDTSVPADPAALIQHVFEATATSFDGTPARITATASPGNQTAGRRIPPSDDREPERPGSLAIADGGGHPAGQRGRAVSWFVVAFISLAFVAAGFGIVLAMPWLFVAGLAAVVAGGLAGWAFGIMADRGVDSRARRRSSGEPDQRRARDG